MKIFGMRYMLEKLSQTLEINLVIINQSWIVSDFYANWYDLVLFIDADRNLLTTAWMYAIQLRCGMIWGN